jgi:hypothetical protein
MAFVADTGNHAMRQIASDGRTTTLAGLSVPNDFGLIRRDGIGPDARFLYPSSVAVAAAGTVYVGDSGNYYGYTTTDGSTIRLGRRAGPPVINIQPQNLAVTAGSAGTFSVNATGVPEPTYQWQLNGANIAGATGNSLKLVSIGTADAGDYTVVVTNPLGSVTSTKATLTVTAAPAPPPPASSGGGGAPSWWFLVVLGGLGILRGFTGRSARW